jgi:oligoendopeptidase F
MLNPRRTILTLAALPLIMSATTATAKPDTRIRSEIPEQYRWDFSAIYAGWEAWEAGMKEFDAKMDEFSALKGTLANGPDAVLKAYRAFDDIGILQYRIYRYPQLQRDVDTRNQDVSGRFQRVLASFAKFNTATSWFSPELLTIPRETMEGWLKSTPALEPYAFTILDTYRQHEHVLDEKGEKLLSYYGRFNGTPTSVYQELSTSDIKFPEIKLSDGTAVTVTPANYGEILEKNRVQADRAAAFEAHLNTFAANGNTYAAIYNSILQRGWASAQARNYPNTLVAALDSNDVPASVVETLVETTRAGTAPLQRYMRLRKKLLGLESYHLYDNGVAIFDSKATYPYDDATKTVIESVAPLGADYTAKYLKFVSGGRIDVYENEGKRSGAYCAGVYGVGPYLLMNYNDTLDAIFTNEN